jgi:LPXTG-site transpeptidase (sortase) family protein
VRSLRLRLVPLIVLAAILAIPIVRHDLKLHGLAANAQAAAARPASSAAISGRPVRIVVPAAAIDLPVVAGSQDARTKVWSVSDSAANYATNTAPANNRLGQTLIYGHAKSTIFGPLLNLKTGSEAIVYTANHHIFTYRYVSSRNVTPDRGDIFQTMRRRQGLVLMTCDGNQFQYRRLMTFRLEKAS